MTYPSSNRFLRPSGYRSLLFVLVEQPSRRWPAPTAYRTAVLDPYPLGRTRDEKRVQLTEIGLWVEPCFHVSCCQDHRHPVVNFRDREVRFRGHHRVGWLLASLVRPLEQPCQSEGVVVRRQDPSPTTLGPLVERRCRDHAPPGAEGGAKGGLLRHRLPPCVVRVLPAEVRVLGPWRLESPAGLDQLSARRHERALVPGKPVFPAACLSISQRGLPRSSTRSNVSNAHPSSTKRRAGKPRFPARLL